MRRASSGNDKQAVAKAAVDAFVRSGMVLGLGTGSTSNYVLEEISIRLKDGRLRDIKGIPTSFATEELARQCGIEILSLRQYPAPDVAIDGADQIAMGTLDLIKGHGGALLREKIIAAAAKKFIVVADSSKKTDLLGKSCAVPIEIPEFALGAVENDLAALGATQIMLRKTVDDQVFYSDNGNLILDCSFHAILSPKILSDKLNSIPAILAHGLFCHLTSGVFLGNTEKVEYFSG